MISVTWWAISLIIFATIIGSFASLFLKIGANNFSFYKNYHLFLKNSYIVLGIFLYGVSAIIGIISYKGGDLSVLYPITSLGYVWTTILAISVLKEKMNVYKYAAIVLIILGVIVIVQ
jgi:multidrug transporter EmrE-like cation transporter